MTVIRALPVSPFPVEGEHAAGYVRRLAAANGLDSLRQLLALFGIAPLSPISGPDAWEKLAVAAGLPVVRFDLLRWPRIGRTREVWLSVVRQPIRQIHLDLDHMKRCPQCLAEDGIVRAEWSLRHVTACPRHRILLSDTCGLCLWPISLNERTDVWHCGPCGTPFAEGESIEASEAQIALSAALISALRDDAEPYFSTLPPAFLELPIGDAAAVVDFLARFALAIEEPDAQPTSRRAPPPKPAEAGRQAERAATILLGWPNSFKELLTELAPSGDARTGVGSSLRQFAGRAGKLLAKLPTTPSGTAIAFVADVVEATLGDTAGYRAGQRAPGGRVRSRARVAMPSASPPISHADAMMRLEGRADGRLARWWIDAGLLSEIRVTPDRAVLVTDEVSMLAASIAFVADDDPRPDPVDLSWIDRSVTGGHDYDKSDFLKDLLDGQIGAWVVDPERPGLSGLRFSRRSVMRRGALGKLKAWITADAHVPMTHFRKAAAQVWDEGQLPESPEARHLAASGALRFSYYDPPGDGRRQYRWHVGDLVTEVQRRSGVVEIDAD